MMLNRKAINGRIPISRRMVPLSFERCAAVLAEARSFDDYRYPHREQKRGLSEKLRLRHGR